MLNAEAEDPNGALALARPSGERGPFSPHTIAKLFQPWDDARKILLAVSGGPDSVALMLLAAEWALSRPGAPALEVATVDHGLRPNSAAEAAEVASLARELGLPHETLVWRGAKPASRIQEIARAARYELLFAHASRIGADVVATAHHADDQAETILFRLLRGSGPAGLAGMAPSRERFGLIHSRPLLQCSKNELVAFCKAEGRRFVTDPSNQDPAFARARMRALLPLLAEAGLGREALLRLGRRAARAEAALIARTDVVASGLALMREPDCVNADISSLAAEPDEIFLRILAGLISPDDPRRLRLDRLETLALDMQRALRAGRPFAATLGGYAVKLRRNGTLAIAREKPRRDRIEDAIA